MWMSFKAGDEPYQTDKPSAERTTGSRAVGPTAGVSGRTCPADSSWSGMGDLASSGAAVPVPDHDGRGVHRQQEGHEDQDAPGGHGLELGARFLGVIVDLDRQ